MTVKQSLAALFLFAALAVLALSGCAAENAAAAGPAEGEAKTAQAPASTPASQTESGAEPEAGSGGTIVVYFSRTGHTRPIADHIADELGADVYEIEAAVPYTDDDIRYYTGCRADKEQADPAARPEIAGELPDLSGYDTVYLGYPIWHGQAPRILCTFLESVDMSGKTIVPFCTSASSPVGTSAENLHVLAPGAAWKDGTRFAAGASREEIAEWLGKD